MSDLVLARNCCLARMLPGEAENGVGTNRSVMVVLSRSNVQNVQCRRPTPFAVADDKTSKRSSNNEDSMCLRMRGQMWYLQDKDMFIYIGTPL